MSNSIKLYATTEHDCSYLPNRQATTLFVDPEQSINPLLYSSLSAIGFRRSGQHIYKPQCNACQGCIPARIDSINFRPNRNQRRTIKRNQDLRVIERREMDKDAYYPIYEAYINQRHADGDMFPPSEEQFVSFLGNGWDTTRYLEIHLDNALIGVAVADVLVDGMSAIYTFFDPQYSHRSLGTFAVLWQIERSISLGKPWVYLGYWIRESKKMAYKKQFQPLYMYQNDEWTEFNANHALPNSVI